MANATGQDASSIDISSEQYRYYTYADGSRFTIVDPVRLAVMPNGSHRVVDASGETHRPTPGYLAVSWKPKDGAPAFVA